VTQGFRSFAQKVFRKTKPFEPVQQVVGKEEQLKKSDVGRPGLGGNLA